MFLSQVLVSLITSSWGQLAWVTSIVLSRLRMSSNVFVPMATLDNSVSLVCPALNVRMSMADLSLDVYPVNAIITPAHVI